MERRTTKKIKYSVHATDQASNRGIDEQLIEQAIKRGSKRKQGHKTIATYTYFEVVYVETEDMIWVITVTPPA